MTKVNGICAETKCAIEVVSREEFEELKEIVVSDNEYIIKNGVALVDVNTVKVHVEIYDGKYLFFVEDLINGVGFNLDLSGHSDKYIKIVARSDVDSADMYVISGTTEFPFSGSSSQIATLTVNKNEQAFYVPIGENFNAKNYLQLAFSYQGAYYIKEIAITSYDGSGSGGGGGSDASVELTQAEYDALPDTKLTSNNNYFVKDASENNGNLIRNGVSYSGGSGGGTNIVKMNDTPITLTTTKVEMDLSDAKLIIIEIIHSFGFTCNCVVLPNRVRSMIDFYDYYSNAMAFLEIKTEDDGISLFNPTNIGSITQNIYKVC